MGLLIGDVLLKVTFCEVIFCEVTFCEVTFCEVTFCEVTFCRGILKHAHAACPCGVDMDVDMRHGHVASSCCIRWNICCCMRWDIAPHAFLHLQVRLQMLSLYMQRRLRWDITLVLVFEMTLHNNSASSSAATNRPRLVMMKGKSAGFKLHWWRLLKKRNYYVWLSHTSKGTIIPSQLPLPCTMYFPGT